MSEASKRLRRLEADHAPDGWPAVQMRDITAVLDELEALREAHTRLSAESAEWLFVTDVFLRLKETE